MGVNVKFLLSLITAALVIESTSHRLTWGLFWSLLCMWDTTFMFSFWIRSNIFLNPWRPLIHILSGRTRNIWEISKQILAFRPVVTGALGAVALKLLNALPALLHSADSVDYFKMQLKSYLFRLTCVHYVCISCINCISCIDFIIYMGLLGHFIFYHFFL